MSKKELLFVASNYKGGTWKKYKTTNCDMYTKDINIE